MAFSDEAAVVGAVSRIAIIVRVSVIGVVCWHVIIGVLDSVVGWIVWLIVNVIVIKSVIVLVVVVSDFRVSIIGGILVVEITVVVVLTALSTPVFIAYTVSALVETSVLDALNTVVGTRALATIAALVTAVFSILCTIANVVHTLVSGEVWITFTLAIRVLRSVGDTMFTVTSSCACAAIAEIVTGTLVKVTCGSTVIVVALASG